MTNSFISFVLMITLAGCAPGNRNEIGQHQADSLGVRIDITATYTPAVGENIALTFLNREAFPVCFSSENLLPGFGTTFVRDQAGRILNGDANPALEEFRGVNLASPLVVLRPGKAHHELMDLTEYHPGRVPLILQISVQAFRCTDLFDGNTADVRPWPVRKVFRLAEGQITDQPALRFGTGEEPPPSTSPIPPS